MKRTPKFIYFDMGNVLLHFDHQIAVRNISQLVGVDESVVQTIVFDSSLQNKYESGQISTREFYDEFSAATKTAADYDQLVHAAADIFTLNTTIVPLLFGLRSTGQRIGILSNTCDAHWQFARSRFRILRDLFQVAALSHEIGCMKPTEKIYQRAAELADCELSEIFFTDDRQENVDAALACGVDAELFTTTNELADRLRFRNVPFNF